MRTKLLLVLACSWCLVQPAAAQSGAATQSPTTAERDSNLEWAHIDSRASANIGYIAFSTPITVRDVLMVMARENLRPATSMEMASVAAQLPRGYRFVAIGSVAARSAGGPVVQVIDAQGATALEELNQLWAVGTVFLGVFAPKNPEPTPTP